MVTADSSRNWFGRRAILALIAGYVLILASVTFARAVVTDLIPSGEGLAHAFLAGVISVLLYGVIAVPFSAVSALPAFLASIFVVHRAGTTPVRAALGGAMTWAAWFGLLAASAARNDITGPDFPTSVFWLPAWTAAGALFGLWIRRANGSSGT